MNDRSDRRSQSDEAGGSSGGADGQSRPVFAKAKRRPHQVSALAGITRELVDSNRARVVMPCGTGKSLLEMWAAQDIGARTVLVLVPTLALLKQAYDLWWQQNDPADWGGPLRTICVCSDQSVSSAGPSEAEIDDIVLGDEAFPTCTNPSVISKFLSSRSASNAVSVIFCTYTSAPTVAEALVLGRRRRRSIDLALFDEAHKTAGDDSKLFGFALFDDNILIKTRLFFTATPRVVRQAGDGEETYSVASMNDESLYGRIAYFMSIKEAVAAGLITPYKVVISVIDHDRLTRMDIQAAGHSRLASQWVLREAMTTYGLRKAITFHSTVARAKAYAETFHRVPNGTEVNALHVSGSQSMAKRQAIMDRFVESHLALVSNARCLTEGVDVPAVDAVAFIDRRRSPVDIVQAIGRTLRTVPGKTYGHVVLPLHVAERSGEDVQYALDQTQLSCVIDVLRAAFENDEELHQLFRAEAASTPAPPGASSRSSNATLCAIERAESSALFAMSQAGDTQPPGKENHGYIDPPIEFHFPGDCASNVIDVRTLFAALKTKVLYAALGSWYEYYSAYAAFIKDHGRHPRPSAKEFSERRLASWAERCRAMLDASEKSNEKVGLLDALGFRWDVREQLDWQERVEQIRVFVRDHGRAPGLGRAEQETTLYDFLRLKERAFRDGTLAPEVAEALGAIPALNFSPEKRNDVQFRTQCEAYAAFVVDHGRHPYLSTDPARREERRLATWAHRQLRLSAQELGPARVAQLAAIPGFPTSTKWGPEQRFAEQLQALYTFLTTFGHRPSVRSEDEDEVKLATFANGSRYGAHTTPAKRAAVVELLERFPAVRPRRKEPAVSDGLPALLRDLKRFVKANGYQPSRYADNPQAPKLFNRIINERRLFAQGVRSSQGVESIDAVLATVPSWARFDRERNPKLKPDVLDVKRIAELKRFVAKHGHRPSSLDDVPLRERELSSWIQYVGTRNRLTGRRSADARAVAAILKGVPTRRDFLWAAARKRATAAKRR